MVAMFTDVAVEPGRWEVLKDAEKRPAHNRVKRHARGEVCTFHHDFVKSQSCRLHVHVGCFVGHNAGYKQIHLGFIWTCQQCTVSKSEVQSKCTLKSEVTAKPEDDAVESKEPKTDTKTLYRQALVQHARDHGWTTRSGERGSARMHFVCQKPTASQLSYFGLLACPCTNSILHQSY